MFYIIIILCAMALIVFFNMLFVPFSLSALLYTALYCVISTIGVIALDGLGALFVRRALPKRWFAHARGIFRVSGRERGFYLKIKIKAWKDKIPELGATTGFSKSVYTGNTDLSYLGRFVMENNYGMIVHIENMLMGALICLIPYYDGASLTMPGRLGIWLPVFLVNFILNLLPLFILRYTNYTLAKLYEREMKRSARTASAAV